MDKAEKRVAVRIALIAAVIFLLIIWVKGVQTDKSDRSEKHELIPENNLVLSEFYAPFRITFEFDIKYGRPAAAEDGENPVGDVSSSDSGSPFTLELLAGGTPAYPNERYTILEGSIENGETQRYRLNCSSFHGKTGHTFEYRLYSADGTLISRTNTAESIVSRPNKIELGFALNAENAVIGSVSYTRGGLVMHYAAKLIVGIVLFILGLIIVPKLEIKFVIMESRRDGMIKLLTLTVADLSVLALLTAINVPGISSLLYFYDLSSAGQFIRDHRVVTIAVCIILLLLSVRKFIADGIVTAHRRKKLKITPLRYAIIVLTQMAVHMVFILISALAVLFTIAFVNQLLQMFAFIVVVVALSFVSTDKAVDESGNIWDVVYMPSFFSN